MALRQCVAHRVRDSRSRLTLCPRAAPSNQFNEVYRHGRFETCGKSVTELTTCFHAKFVVSREPERAKARMRERTKRASPHSPRSRAQKMMDDAIRANRKVATEPPPWDLKSQGSWDP